MAKHNEIGKKGEQLARDYLVGKGYDILDLNWRYNHKEIDIVAKKDALIIFVEVKTRSTLAFELPQEAVTIKKQKNLVYAADIYINKNDVDLDSRFDIITVLGVEPMKILEHLQGAFEPHEFLNE